MVLAEHVAQFLYCLFGIDRICTHWDHIRRAKVAASIWAGIRTIPVGDAHVDSRFEFHLEQVEAGIRLNSDAHQGLSFVFPTGYNFLERTAKIQTPGVEFMHADPKVS